MQGKPDRFTMVFEGDLREFKGNPLYAVTDWGVPASVGVGDAFARLDAYEAALREIVAPCKVEDPWEMLNDIVDIARKALGDA